MAEALLFFSPAELLLEKGQKEGIGGMYMGIIFLLPWHGFSRVEAAAPLLVVCSC
jgi:hypothetical protein